MNILSEITEKEKKYKYIKEINLSRNLDSDEGLLYDLEMVLSTFPCEKKDVFIIFFEKIRDICFNDLNNCLAVGIKIEDISSYQLEGIKYKVSEVGEELFSFYCNSISIIES